MSKMDSKLNVSAVIPVYNSAAFIRETVESLINQTYPLSEIILVDDCSPDDSYAICQQLAEAHPDLLRLHRMPRNSGPSPTRNFGVGQAQGDWILFMDGDDLAEPNLLESLVHRLEQLRGENPADWVLLHGAYRQISETGDFISEIHGWQQVQPEEMLGYLLVRNRIPTASGVFVKRDAFIKVGGFREDMKYSEDYELWLRLAQQGGFGYVDEALVCLRRHSSNLSKLVGNMIEAVKGILRQYSLSFIEEAIQRRHLPWETNQLDFASVLYLLENWEEGVRAVQEAIGRNPDLPTGHFQLGLYHLHQENWLAAVDAFERVLELSPNHGAALNNLGALYALLGDGEKGREYIKRALSLFPVYLDANHNLQQLSTGLKVELGQVKFTWRELRPVLLSYQG